MKRTFAVLLALTMLATACGDDDASGDDDGRQSAIDQLSAQLSEDASISGDDLPLEIGAEEALCVASDLVDEFGTERITAALDVDFEVFMAAATAAERRTTLDVILACVDFESALATQFTGEGLSADSAECVSEGLLGSDPFLDAVAESMGGAGDASFDDPAIVAALLPMMLDCLSPEELANLGGE